MRAMRSVAPAALAAALLLAACAAPDDATPETASETGGASGDGARAGAEPEVEIADAEHAVEPPGPREGPLLPDDMLVVSQEPLPEETVDAVRELDGVAEVDVVSVAQLPVENKLYNVAAVDPGTYRRFTQDVSADLQEQWERVAGGEVSVDADLEKRLPVDDDGYLELGAGEEAQRLHVGAYAPQVEGIDLVVNEKWGETLGLRLGNALVISTGAVSPQSVRKPLQQLLGEEASIQDLDIVATAGLDTQAVQTAIYVGSFSDAVGTFTYTVLGGGRIAPDPAWVRTHITTATVPILGSVTCNKAMMPQLEAALREVVQRGLADEIYPDQYAGCYYPRFIAGSTKLSNHSFGLAFDINVPGNQRGTVGDLDRGVVDIFKRWGFGWGGDWSYTDPMHFELDRIVEPG